MQAWISGDAARFTSKLLREMKERGYECFWGDDGGEEFNFTPSTTEREIVEMADSVDECWLAFRNGQQSHCHVFLVWGNSLSESLADWSWNDDNAKNVMDEVSRLLWDHFEQVEASR